MQQRENHELVEAFLVIDQPRQRLSHWGQALGPLDDKRAPTIVNVSAYYDPDGDQALIALRYDEYSLGRDGLAFVVEIALLAEIGMIQPAELSEGDRRRFLNERLVKCTVHVGDQRSVVGVLTELVRRVRELKAAPKQTVIGSLPIRPPQLPSARGLPTKPSGDEPLLLKAKGTRDDLTPAARGTRDKLLTPPGIQLAPSPALEPLRQPPRMSPHVVARSNRPPPQQEQTKTISPVDAYRKATESMPPPIRAREVRAERVPERGVENVSTDVFMPSAAGPTPPGIIYARYLRSGRWVPIRIGALSLKGAALMAGALPRINDHVDIALSFGATRALVRGNVGKVSSRQETQMTGTATFSVNFQLDDASRRQLTALLTAARAANITIKPPPPRATRRYPVEWPVCLGTNRGAVRADALDISRDGMFVKPVHALTLDTVLNYSSVLDDGEAPVSGRAQVVRHITEAEARACGLAAGFGLHILEMGDADRQRWLAFLGRIERRAERRVLIGASPTRLAELQTVLASIGYAVTGGTDPGALVQLASTEARPVDAVLIDAQWLTPQMSAEWVESLFAARNVPCVTLHGDAKRARAAIDKLLSVA